MDAVEADIRRCEELWFEDGNIILRAEHTIFRLYKGFLASHSSIFHDMLALPQPADGSAETYENCEVVRMNDSAYELTEFNASDPLLARTACWRTRVRHPVHRGLWPFKSMILNPTSVIITQHPLWAVFIPSQAVIITYTRQSSMAHPVDAMADPGTPTGCPRQKRVGRVIKALYRQCVLHAHPSYIR
jgi:hypothetical protein